MISSRNIGYTPVVMCFVTCPRPPQDNLFEWHFSVRGPPDSDFDGGIYHGRIVLPPEYPMKPPSIILLTVSPFTHLESLNQTLKMGRWLIKWAVMCRSSDSRPTQIVGRVVDFTDTESGRTSNNCKYNSGLAKKIYIY